MGRRDKGTTDLVGFSLEELRGNTKSHGPESRIVGPLFAGPTLTRKRGNSMGEEGNKLLRRNREEKLVGVTPL